MFDKILVAIDGSPASEKALAAAVDLAEHYQTEVVAIGVAEVPEVVDMVDEVDELRRGAEAHFRRIGEAAAEFARSRHVSLRSVVLRGHAADAIIRFAESEDASLAVIGPHGRSRISRFFLGSTGDRVSEHCHCSVLIVR
jgi:nucleotide-binding universal stress UspA family protein